MAKTPAWGTTWFHQNDISFLLICRYLLWVVHFRVAANVELLLTGLDLLEDLDLHLPDKLEFLKQLIDLGSLPATSFPPRVSFQEYISATQTIHSIERSRSEYWQLVYDFCSDVPISKDTYPLHIYSLISFLKGLQLVPIESTYDKDVLRIIVDNEKRLNRHSTKPEVVNAIRYYDNVHERLRSTPPKEWHPPQVRCCTRCVGIVTDFQLQIAHKCPYCTPLLVRTFA